MLVFFIHGVATRTVQYADDLKVLLREEFTTRGEPIPQFHSSFWGDVLSDVGKIWNWIHQDLQTLKTQDPSVDIGEIFRYQQFRQGLLSEFVGDAFTYLNPERGAKIRELIADHLYDFIRLNPEASDIHIVAHSLGSVILWDILFSDRFNDNDPAFKIRQIIKGLSHSSETRKVVLRSITTIGSPILFFNTMLGVTPEMLKTFFNKYQQQPLRWMNIIHASDIIAYPLRSSFNIEPCCNFFFKDIYLQTDANNAEKTVRNFTKSTEKFIQAVGQLNAAIPAAISQTPIIAGAGDAHIGYWNCPKTAELIASNILGNSAQSSANGSLLDLVISRLQKVRGITKDAMQLSCRTLMDETLVELKLKDGSGMLRFCVNPLKIYHVYVFDSKGVCKYVGYVGWLDAEALKQEIELIKNKYLH